MAEYLSIIRLAIALALMSYAAVLDWRTRRVANWVWMLMGALGMAILAIDMLQTDNSIGITGDIAPYFLIFIPILAMYIEPFREWGYEVKGIDMVTVMLGLAGFAGALALISMEGFTRPVIVLLTIPIMMFIFILFYHTGLIHGGADAKAFIVLAILFPVYPIIQNLPLIEYPVNIIENIQLTYPFTFLILMNAAIISVLVVSLSLFIKNLARGDRGFPEMFMGYMMDIHDIPKSFVWPMEKIIDGEHVLVLKPRRSDDVKAELAALKEQGLTRIWVNPKIPFIIPMLLGIIFSVVIGNLMVLFF